MFGCGIGVCLANTIWARSLSMALIAWLEDYVDDVQAHSDQLVNINWATRASSVGTLARQPA